MKKIICISLCLVLICFAGCTKEETAKDFGTKNGVNEILEAEKAAADNKNISSESQPEDLAESGQKEKNENQEDLDNKADVDLTNLSSTMVYSNVYNMMVVPQDYVGKTVKMKGVYAYRHDETTGNYYFACIIKDATACCAQGIEFELTQDYTYPNDYPKGGEEITVFGTFDTYMEGQYTYCTLRNAKLL